MADENLSVEITAIDRATEVMKGVSRSTEDFTRRADEAAKTLSKGTVSGREMAMALSSVSQALGETSPAMSMATIHASRFIAAMEGASLSSKITAATVVGLGAAAAVMVAQFMEVEKVNARLAEIDRAVGSLDLGALRSGLSKTSIELETLDRQTSTWTGTFIVGLKNLVALLPGVPNEIEAASMAMEKLRAGLEQVLPFYEKLEAAKHAEAMTALEAANLQAYAQNLLAAGQLPRGAEAWYAGQMTALIQAQAAAAQQAAFQQRQKEFMEASVRGTLDIESDAIVARYNQTIEQIKAKTALQLENLQGSVLKLGEAISNSTGKVMGIELKYVADVGAAWSSLGEMKRTLSDQAIAWTMNEYDKQIAAVDKWEKDSVAKVDEKFGHTREAEALEEQIVREASERKAQITADWTKKVQDALANQVDAFEEAYRLMGKRVTVTQDDINASAAKGTQDLKGEYDRRVQNAIDAQLYWLGFYRNKQQEELDVAAGTIDRIYARRQQDLRDLTMIYTFMAERDHSFWYAMQAGAADTYAHLGTFWQNVSGGFAETFQDVQRLGSDLFFDTFSGNLRNLGTDFDDFGKRILRTLSDIMANAVTREFLTLFLPSGLLTAGGLGGPGLALGAAQLMATTTGGPAGASSGGGGGLLSPITNLITGIKTLYSAVTGASTGGVGGAIENVLGIPGLMKALGLGGAASVFPTGMGIGEEAMGITGAGTGGAAALFPTGMGIGEEAMGLTGAGAGAGLGGTISMIAMPLAMAGMGIAQLLGVGSHKYTEAERQSLGLGTLQLNPEMAQTLFDMMRAGTLTADWLSTRVGQTPDSAPYSGYLGPEIWGFVGNALQKYGTDWGVTQAMLDVFGRAQQGVYAYGWTPSGLGEIPPTNWPEATGGGRQHGGPIEAGKAYLIHSPEIYQVDAPGHMTSQRDTQALLSGQGGGEQSAGTIVVHGPLLVIENRGVIGPDIPTDWVRKLEKCLRDRMRLRLQVR